jgi:uncharacterized protein
MGVDSPDSTAAPAATDLATMIQNFDSFTSMMNMWAQTAGRDSPGSIRLAANLDLTALDNLYRDDHYAGRIVDLLPTECTRRGWEFLYQESVKGERDPLGAEFHRLCATEHFLAADKLGRKDGDCAIYMLIDDGRTPEQSIDWSNIRSVNGLLEIERWFFQPTRWHADWTQPRFGEPEVYSVSPFSSGGSNVGSVQIHADRLLVFPGRWLPPRLRAYNAHHHDSVLELCWRVLLDFSRSETDLPKIMRSFSQAVLQMKGLQALLASGDNSRAMSRLSTLNAGLSVNSIALLDEGEKLEFPSRTVNGLHLLHDRIAQGLASAAEMPMTLLFGQSPGGLSTDDKSGRANWYDRVADRQANAYGPLIQRLGKIVALAKQGPCGGQEPKGWTYQFRPLLTPTHEEEIDARNKQAMTDHIYVVDGVLKPEEVRASRWGGARWSAETTLTEGLPVPPPKPGNPTPDNPGHSPLDHLPLGSLAPETVSKQSAPEADPTAIEPDETGTE